MTKLSQKTKENRLLVVLLIIFTILTIITFNHVVSFSSTYVPMCSDEFDIINECNCIPSEMIENSTIFKQLWEKITK